MQAIDLMTSREISIRQPLGSGAMACKLDAAGLAEAAVAVTRAIAANVDLVVINKFSKQEAAGEGLRDERRLAESRRSQIQPKVLRDKCRHRRQHASPNWRQSMISRLTHLAKYLSAGDVSQGTTSFLRMA